MSALRPKGFERRASYCERRLAGLSACTGEIGDAGFDIVDASIKRERRTRFTDERLMKMLRSPAFWGPGFDPKRHRVMLDRLKSKLRIEKGEAPTYVPVAQDVIVVARKRR